MVPAVRLDIASDLGLHPILGVELSELEPPNSALRTWPSDSVRERLTCSYMPVGTSSNPLVPHPCHTPVRPTASVTLTRSAIAPTGTGLAGTALIKTLAPHAQRALDHGETGPRLSGMR